MIRKNSHGEHRTWRRWMGAFLVAAALCLLVSPTLTQSASAEEEEVQVLLETSAEVQTLAEDATPQVTLSQSSVTFHTTSQSATLTATLSLGDETQEADSYSVSWKSSKTSVATVDSNTGVVKPKANGSATITATVSYTDAEENAVTITSDCAVKVDFYTGIYQDPDGTDKYYYKNGKVDTSITALTKINGTWYNLVKGKVVGNTVAKNSNGWWYINSSGKVDRSYTGFAKNSSGSWYAEKGKVTKTVNGVYQDTTGALGAKNEWYYVLNSKVQYSFTGLADYKNASGWWYITKGKVDRSVTTVAKNKNGWWYVQNGKVNRSYTGFGKNSHGSWYAQKGKVTKKVNGVYKDTTGALGTKNAWYYVLNSKVQYSFTGLANYKNASGWWYITKGKVDRSYTGVGTNKNGTWYVENGKVKRITKKLTLDGKTYYFSNGKATTGWAKVSGSYYYFDRSTGIMQSGKTVDGITLSSSGKAKASSDDVTKIKTMIKARNIYLSIVKSSDSKSTQLRKCFDWSATLKYKRNKYFSQVKAQYPNTWTCIYANDSFDRVGGTCIAQSCAFAYLAKECGYQPYVCDTGGHAWVEINGLVYDPGMVLPGYTGVYYGGTPKAANRHYLYRTSI